jgi:hypothetical protein
MDDLDNHFEIEGTEGIEIEGAPPEERFIGCQIWWLSLVFPIIGRSKGQLIVALYLFKQHVRTGKWTFTVPNKELGAWGVSRQTKYRTLDLLAGAGVIAVKHNGQGALIVTILIRNHRRRRRSR